MDGSESQARLSSTGRPSEPQSRKLEFDATAPKQPEHEGHVLCSIIPPRAKFPSFSARSQMRTCRVFSFVSLKIAKGLRRCQRTTRDCHTLQGIFSGSRARAE